MAAPRQWLVVCHRVLGLPADWGTLATIPSKQTSLYPAELRWSMVWAYSTAFCPVARPSPAPRLLRAYGYQAQVFDHHSTYPGSPHKGALSEVLECLFDLLAGIHHKRAVPGYRLAKRFPGHKQIPDGVVRGPDVDKIPISKDDQSGVLDGFSVLQARDTKLALTLEDVGKGRVPSFDWLSELAILR